MDISAFGVQRLDTAHIPLSSSGGGPGAAGMPVNPFAAGRDSGFEEILEKARRAKPASGGDGTLPLPKKDGIDKTDKLYEACMELETFLIKNLIKSMRSTVQKTNLIDTGFAGEVYEDMLYDEYAKSFAQNANLGFAEMAYRELTGMR